MRRSSGGRVLILVAIAITIVMAGAQFWYSVVNADVQLTQRPRTVHIGHLAADQVPGRLDYVFRSKTQGSGSPSEITAWEPGGNLLFSIPPDSTAPIDEVIDVADLDNDGNAEIIAISHGDGVSSSPVLWVYDGDGTLRFNYVFPSGGLTLTDLNVKVYDVLPGRTQKRIVVVPDTATYAANHASSLVYFFNGQGVLLATQSVSQHDGNPFSGEILTFPSISVGDVNGTGVNDIIVMVKGRILGFDQDGNKLFYKQIDDRNGTFTNYQTALDQAPNGQVWSGRRYGFRQLIDVDGDGQLEFVVAADNNNIPDPTVDPAGVIPGAVYQVYKLFPPSTTDFLAPVWSNWIPNADVNYDPAALAPFGYKLGIPALGVIDVNGDGIPDIIVNDCGTVGEHAGSCDPTTTSVDIINARTGQVNRGVIPGICIDVRFLNAGQAVPDLLVYNPATSTNQYSIWRFTPGTYTATQLPGAIPDNTAFAVTTEQAPMTGESDRHNAVIVANSNGVGQWIAYSPANLQSTNFCPSGFGGWSTAGGSISQTLSVPSRPADIIDVQPVNDPANYQWIMNVESSCGNLTNTVETFVQSGAGLVPDGILPVSASPSLTSISPSTAVPGTTSVPLTIVGANLTGATAVTFSLSGTPSSAITVSNIQVSSDGTTLTGNLTVQASAALGTYSVTVTASHGTSNALSFTVAIQPDFTLAISPGTVSVVQGSSGSATVTVGSVGGFSSPVSLSVTGLPSGVTGTLTPGSVTPSGGGAASTLTLTASSSAATGTFAVTLSGGSTNPSLSHTLTFNVTVSIPASFTLALTSSNLTMAQGSSATTTVTVSSINGFSAPVALTLPSPPNGVTATFNPSTVTPPVGGSASSTLTLTASSTATSGIFTVNIFGNSSSASAMVQLTLNITVILQPDFSISASPGTVNAIQGGTGGSTTVTIGSINNFNSSTGFTISGLPAGVTATFAPSSVTPPAGGSASSTLSLLASAAAATGTSTLTITGSSSSPSITHSTTLTLTISPPPPPDFSLSASPSSLAVNQGSSATSTVKVTSINGFNSATSLAVSGAPAGVSASLSPSSVTPPVNISASSTLNVSVSSSATTGSFTLTITGTSGTLTHTLSIGLTISSPPPPAPDFSLSLSPSSVTLMPSSSATTTVTVASIGGFTDTVTLSASGLPSGVSASFSPSSVTPPSGGSASSSLTISASSSAVAGTYTVTIAGNAGNTSHTATLTLTIGTPPPNFTLSVAPQSISVAQGSGASATVTVGSVNGFNSATSLSVSGLPSGVTATFSPTSVTPPAGGSGASTLTLAASASAVTGSFTLTITGSSGSLSHSASLTLTVTAPPDFTVAAAPSSLTVAQGSSGTTTVNVGSLNNFSSAVNLSVSGVPSGVTATFSPASVTPPVNSTTASTLTLAVSATATTGSFNVTITGTSGSTSHSTTLTLTIAAKDFSIGVSPSSVSVTAGGSSATSTVTITSLNGFNSATGLSITGLPSGVTASFSPTSVTPPAGGGASSTLTLTASTSAAAGTFTLTVTGSSGSLQHSATLALTVTVANNPVPSISSISPATVFSGGSDFTLTVTGTGFVSSSVINVQVGNTNGPRPTTFVSATQLTVQITASDIANSGQIGISVTNPRPGGGTSNTASLNVF